MVSTPENLKTFEALRQVVEALRGPEGCPWDKEQNHRSLAPYAIEEAYELVEAIEEGSDQELIEELGDYLFQVVLHTEIARGEGRFTMEEVLSTLNNKMIRRHPHVFAAQKVSSSREVLDNWAQLKNAEKSQSPSFQIPAQLPSLTQAHKIGVKTQADRFDWEQVQDVMAKVREELEELSHEIKAQNQARIEAEMGDLLFSVAQLARHLGCEAETCLRQTNRRFERRYFQMLEVAQKQGLIPAGLAVAEQRQQFKGLSLAQKEELWQQVKKHEATLPPSTDT